MFNGSSNQGEKLTDYTNMISNIDYAEHVGQGTKPVTPKDQKIIFPTLLHITPHEVLTASRNTTFHIKYIPGNNTPLHHGKMPDFANAKPPPLKKKTTKRGFNIPLSNPFCLQIWWLVFLDTLTQLLKDNTWLANLNSNQRIRLLNNCGIYNNLTVSDKKRLQSIRHFKAFICNLLGITNNTE